jgi:hypothetical protein
MASVIRFFSQDRGNTAGVAYSRRNGYTLSLLKLWRTATPFALAAIMAVFAAQPQWAQAITGANVAPLEGPGAGSDTVLIYGSGLQGNTTIQSVISLDILDWITCPSSMTISNGPNRLQFSFSANTGATRSAHIVLQPVNGAPSVTVTVTQAGAGFTPAGPLPIVTSVIGPQTIDADSQGNLYITEATGANLYEWNASTQKVTTLASRAKNTFVDAAIDSLGNSFALENTPDGKYGTTVEKFAGPQGGTSVILASNSTDTQYLFPSGICVDPAGSNVYVTTVDVSDKCLVDQFGKVYELETTSGFDDLGFFLATPTNNTYKTPPQGQAFFPVTTGTDACGNQLTGVSGTIYGLAKDGSGFIYFLDQNGTRLNRWDPTSPFFECQPPGPPSIVPHYTSFTTVVPNLTFPAFSLAADLMGNIYLSEMPFSRIREIPRAYLSSVGPFNEPVGGGSETIQILPATQSLTGPYAPVSDSNWLTPVVSGNGTVSFTLGANSGPPRTGIISVLGVSIPVTQAETQTPAAIAIVSGNNQQGAVGGNPFKTNLLVKVTNQIGDPVANAPVTFTSPAQTIVINTDQRGYAADTSVNAYAVGPLSVTASTTGGLSRTFSLTGVPRGITVLSGSGQQVFVGGMSGPLTVGVYDSDGVPQVAAPVTFSIPSGGPSGLISGGTSATILASDFGTASASVQANSTPGTYQVTASVTVPGVSPASCVFTLTNVTQLQELVGSQTAFTNNNYPLPLSLKVVDANNQPMANALVDFEVGNPFGPGAVFSNGNGGYQIHTGADGLATALPMTANQFAGTFTGFAFVTFPNGGSLTAGWTLTNQQSAILEGAYQTGVTTRTLTQPFIVQASANATNSMVFTVVPGSTGAGGSFHGQNSVTVNLDSQGYGTSPLLTANGTPGTFTVTANDGITTSVSTVTTTTCLNPTSPQVAVTSPADYDPRLPYSIVTGSLRYILANACAGSTIDLSSLSGNISLQSRLRIDDDMTLTGPAAGTQAIDGGNQTRLFFIGNGSVTLSNLTLQNGLAKGGASMFGGGAAGMGGAIFMAAGNVTMNNVNFQSNEALGGSSGTATQCAGCLYGGGGFGGDALTPDQGGASGDLFGLAGSRYGVSGGPGAGGAANAAFHTPSGNAGNGGFGAGGGTGFYIAALSSSGNGGFGGGGGGGAYGCSPVIPNCGAQLVAGTGGYGAGSGYAPFGPSAGAGGSGAGLGGAIFAYTGKLTLNGVQFFNNSAVGGTVYGLTGQPTVVGQGKGGALFIYDGALVVNKASTFGTNAQSNVAAAAGLPGNGNSAPPYTNGATCPGQDTADVCGFLGGPPAVTITVPGNATFLLSGVSYTGSQTLALVAGQYTLAASVAQSTGVGTQLGFASWSDGGAASHTITVGSSGLSITGTFNTQYLLTISATSGGYVTPASGGYYSSGQTLNLTATPSVGSAFVNWTGPVASPNSASTVVVVNAPAAIVANFAPTQTVNVNVPFDVNYTLNGVNYSGPQFVKLGPGQYTLSTTSPQLSGTGTQQETFVSWSDGGALSHSITVGSSPLSISANFSTQYQLLATAGSGGSILPVTGFYPAGTIVNLAATPDANSVFHSWAGSVASYSSATTTITMNQTATITANFWPAPVSCDAAPGNLTALWRGDGDFTDFYQVNNLTAGGDVSFAPGLVNQAFSFDGTQSPFVSIPAGAFPAQPGNGPFTFDAWFQTAGGNGGVILGQQDVAPYAAGSAGWAPAIYVGTDGLLYIETFYSGSINQQVSELPVNDNKWHHVAVTYDGGTEYAYVDAAIIGRITNYTQAPNGSTLFYQLGTGYTSGWPATNNAWYTFNGLIDDVAVYSRALTDVEILHIAQAGKFGKCNPPLPTNVQVALTGGSNPTAYGQQVTFTATVGGALNAAPLDGSVFWSANAGCPNSTLSGGSTTATCTTTYLPVGSDTVTASYSGNSGYQGSTGSITQTVNRVANLFPTTVQIGTSGSPSNFGQAVTFNAFVQKVSGGGLLTGSVQFVIDGVNAGAPVPLPSFVQDSYTITSPGITTLSIGNHTVTAVYSGDANFASSSATLSGGQTVVDGQNVQLVSGNNQTAATTRTLALPFILQTAGNAAAGNAITFTVVPNNGAGGTFPGGLSSVPVTTDANGFATSPQLIANGTPGSFTVTGSDGSETVTFNVATTQCVTPSVTNKNDSGTGSLRYAVDNACAGSTIDLTNLSGTIGLNSRIRMDDNLTINGPGSNSLTISGQNQTRIFFVGGGTVSISGLTLANGLGAGFSSGPSGSSAGMGGAIFMNGGVVNLTGVAFSGNSAQGANPFPIDKLGGAGFGGVSAGVYGGPGGDLFGMGGLILNTGVIGTAGPGAGGGFADGSGLPGQSGAVGGNGGFGGGGGIGGNGGFGGGGGGNNTLGNGVATPGTGGFGAGNGTETGGASAGFGGAIFEYAGTLTLMNTTFTGNSAAGGIWSEGNGQGKGGALFIYGGATAYNNGSTFSSNTAADAGSPGIGNSAPPYVNGATCPGQDDADICGIVAPAPATTLSVAVTSSGTFLEGSQAEWDITVSNAAGSLAASAAVSMQDTLPAGYTVSGFGATDTGTWSCSGSGSQTASCSATAPLAGSQSYPVIHLLVNVPAASPVSVTDTALVFGGGDPVHTNVSTAASGTNSVTVTQVPANIAVVAGTAPQSAKTGTQFAQPLTVVVTDGGANPISGVTVTFSAPSTGASAALSTPSPTDANGQASVTATANTILGTYQVTATISGSSASALFTLSNTLNGTRPPPTACVAAPANVTAWWKGDGSANDETTLYNATLGGDVSFAPGVVGQAFSFDGTQSPFVAVPAGAFPAQPGNGPFSLETWFQTSGGNGGVILGQQAMAPYAAAQGGWSPAIYVGTDGNLYVEMFYNGGLNQSVGPTPVNDNQWHHVAVTYDGSSEIAYLDGANIGQSLSFTQAPNGSPLSYQLGTGYTQGWPATNNGWYTFNGLIDEPTVYSRALTAGEVLGIAQAASYGKCDPVAAVNPGTLNFAGIPQGQTATQAAVLSNPGNAPLTISAIAVDTGDTNFTVLSGNTQDCAVGAPVQPAASCSVRVQFSPQGAGAINGQVLITDNSVVSQGTQVIGLAGSGPSLVPPTVTFTGPSSAVYGSTFTPVAGTNSGAVAAITASGPCQANGSVITMTGATGMCQLQATWPATANFAPASATLNVNAAPAVVTATVTVANKTFDGTTTGTVNLCALSNVLPADAANLACTAAAAAFASPGVGNNIPVSVSGIALGGSAAANYQLSSTTAATTANIVFGSADSACVASPAGVTAWWKGDGDATDVTGAFGATPGGDVSFASGKVGQAFSFDGTQSPYVSLPAGAFPPEPSNAPFTFETWFQTAGGNGGVILGEQSGVLYQSSLAGWTPAIYVGTDGKLYAQMFYGAGGLQQVVSSIPVNDNAWHHVAVAYDGTNEVVYLDAGTIGAINGLVQAPNGPSLGYELGTGYTQGWQATNSGWYTFNGLIDEPAVYSRALTAGEVAGIVQSEAYGKCNPGASVDPGTLTFSNTPPGQTATLTAVLSNPGNAPLTITSIAADASDTNFSVLSGNAGDCATGTPVQPNASCNIRVQFAPPSAGSPSGSVTVHDNSLYNAGVQTVQLTATALSPQTITFGNIATQIVGTPLTLAASATSGLPVVFTATTPAICSVTGNMATFLTYGSCTITATQPGNGTYSAANPVSQTFSVVSPQTITFLGIGAQMVGTPLILTATASSGLPVSYASSTTKVCSVSGNTVSFAANGTCTIKASQAGNANYLPATPVTQSFSVGKQAQSITWATIPAQTVLQTVDLTATASSGLPITYASSSTSICTVSGATASLIAGGTCTIKATQAGNTVYASKTASQSFAVNKLAQSITFAAIATPQSVGGQATLTATASSGLAVTVQSSPSSVCTISGSTVSFVASGTCKLTATQPGNGIYAAATAASQSIAVNKIAQTISFGPIANQNSGSSLALTASASSGLPVTYTASPASVCTVSGSNASLVGGGTCTITAKQPGNATYSAAPSVSQSFIVGKLSQSISFPAIPAQNVNATVTLAATATSGLTVSYTATPSSVCKVSGSTASMVGAGTCTITASQAGNAIYAAATAVPQSFLVSKLAQTISFGSIGTQTVGALLSLNATASSGLAVSYSATPSSVCKVSGSTATMAASGTCTITASQAGNSQYAAATAVPVSFAVTKVAQTITFNPISTQSVGTLLTLTATASSGLTVTYTATPSKVCKVSGSAVTLSAAGTCNVTAAQSGNATYAAAASVLQSFQVVP